MVGFVSKICATSAVATGVLAIKTSSKDGSEFEVGTSFAEFGGLTRRVRNNPHGRSYLGAGESESGDEPGDEPDADLFDLRPGQPGHESMMRFRDHWTEIDHLEHKLNIARTRLAELKGHLESPHNPQFDHKYVEAKKREERRIDLLQKKLLRRAQAGTQGIRPVDAER